MTTLEHISSELVEYLKKAEEELRKEIEQVVKHFQEFQGQFALIDMSD